MDALYLFHPSAFCFSIFNIFFQRLPLSVLQVTSSSFCYLQSFSSPITKKKVSLLTFLFQICPFWYTFYQMKNGPRLGLSFHSTKGDKSDAFKFYLIVFSYSIKITFKQSLNPILHLVVFEISQQATSGNYKTSLRTMIAYMSIIMLSLET